MFDSSFDLVEGLFDLGEFVLSAVREFEEGALSAKEGTRSS